MSVNNIFVDVDDILQHNEPATDVIRYINGITNYEIMTERLVKQGFTVTLRTPISKYFKISYLFVHSREHTIYIMKDFKGLFNTPFVSFDNIPDIFIGTEDALLSTIYYLCNQITRHYGIYGIDLPPWRSLKNIKDIWFGKKYLSDVIFTDYIIAFKS